MTPFTWNADREVINGGAALRTCFGMKWWNFLTNAGWQPIDLTPRLAGGTIVISNAPYRAEFPVLANDWSTVQSTNKYDVWTKETRDDAPVGISKRYPRTDAVPGVVASNGIVYPLAFVDISADRVVEFHEQEIRDLVRFSAEPPGRGPVEVPFELDFGALPILESIGHGKHAEERDFRSDRTITKGLSFTTGRFRGLKIKAPRVWDSAGRSAPIQIAGKVVGTRFVGKKIIPRGFFERVTFPVYADTTTTFYPDPNPESTSFDGFVLQNGTDVWANVRGGAGTSASDNDTTLIVALYADFSSGDWLEFDRTIALIDTSGLPDNATISAANFGVKPKFAPNNDFSQSVALVGSTPSSDTSLDPTDYGQLGSTRYASDIALASFSNGAFSAFSLNGSGIAAIDVGGITKLGLIMDGDLDDDEPTWIEAGSADLQIASADTSGTGSDPYLEVTYTIPSSARSNNLLLLGVG